MGIERGVYHYILTVARAISGDGWAIRERTGTLAVQLRIDLLGCAI